LLVRATLRTPMAEFGVSCHAGACGAFPQGCGACPPETRHFQTVQKTSTRENAQESKREKFPARMLSLTMTAHPGADVAQGQALCGAICRKRDL